ncbi:hypothetical protein [Cellvibrio sp.]|uniref:hypothetical protein n=1 Tax=Cellvibrio sp. TaxID=1965322 RepID=UPI003964824B
MIKKTFCLMLLGLIATYTTAEESTYPWIEYDASKVAPQEKISTNCATLSVTDKTLKFYRPEFPLEGFRAETSGYAVFDFQIDETGSTKNIEFITGSEKVQYGFKRNSLISLKRIKFDVTDEWLQSCKEQRYRIGYAYHLMSNCTYKEFPKPIINVCVTGEIAHLR